MASRRPLVVVSGTVQELPSGDSVAGAGGVVLTEVEVDLGPHPSTSRAVTVTDAGVSGASIIAAWPSGSPATGRGSDDQLWDSISIACKPGTGQFTAMITASGRVKGKRKIIYTVS